MFEGFDRWQGSCLPGQSLADGGADPVGTEIESDYYINLNFGNPAGSG